MQAISRIAVLSLFAVGCAHAQPTQNHAEAPESPTPLASAPVPAQLAPVSPDFQAAMANSQLATYRYTQLTEQALALKKLCDTGFGPADICPKAGNGTGQGVSGAVQGELPTVTEITGARSGLSAVLALPDGRRLLVHPGSRLPDGSQVAAISHDDVRIGRTGADDLILSFAGAEPK